MEPIKKSIRRDMIRAYAPEAGGGEVLISIVAGLEERFAVSILSVFVPLLKERGDGVSVSFGRWARRAGFCGVSVIRVSK